MSKAKKPTFKKLKIKKGDTVIVLSGRDKNKKGKVLEVFLDSSEVIVERVNIVKRHLRPTRSFQGGIIEKPLPVKISKLMLVCPRCNTPARVKRQINEDKLVRVCKRCNEIVDKVK
ncbi:50S ribosomal protein L24 [Candidatus Saganbacteria bacterium CG08_land_8_20_14_0_20_45_16]|uniref:Large ribosomal subunit protein uL24 n=1 Tax=Candidatus Saganbacteria bacterium CG08_land_8_20_14_0_20_45_16 TaxID=2014293 RepID=A0A2H0XXE3_UNCSA|nr:MAG: 50S ribosomal protein L24 [Candidatus Saganbacteria bacterium CG08_land_8_20_14_0_20_45_16]